MIDLKTFVSETIQQIIEGTKDAGSYIKENIKHDEYGYVSIGSGKPSKIQFDISVTTSETAKKEGKAGILIHVVDFGVKGSDSLEATSINKIRFSVPVNFARIANGKAPDLHS